MKNMARVEGSICNAYLVEEASLFCSYYFEEHVHTRHRRVTRNNDVCGENWEENEFSNILDEHLDRPHRGNYHWKSFMLHTPIYC